MLDSHPAWEGWCVKIIFWKLATQILAGSILILLLTSVSKGRSKATPSPDESALLTEPLALQEWGRFPESAPLNCPAGPICCRSLSAREQQIFGLSPTASQTF